jgi:NADH-quinone oxidoreductase subunit L
MNRIGDLGLLIGIFIIGSLFSTLDYATLKNGYRYRFRYVLDLCCRFRIYWCLWKISTNSIVYLAARCDGRSLLSALAATMVTAGIFMITRLNYLFDLAPDVQNIIAIIGAVTSLVTIALVQTDIKSTCLLYRLSIGIDVLSFRTWRIRSRRFSCNYTCFLQGLLVLRFGSVIHALHGEQDIKWVG